MTTREQRIAKFNANRPVYQAVPKAESLARTAKDRKLCASLEEAIKRSGLKDGMTVSFHHAFRAGDFIVNMVMDKIAEMGFKNLTLASSSLIDSHHPIINHIKNGVVTKIYSSGLRGELAEQNFSWFIGRAGKHSLPRRPRAFGKIRRTENRRRLFRCALL